MPFTAPRGARGQAPAGSLMVFEQCIRYAGLAVGLMVVEQCIRYAGLAVGLKPWRGEAKAAGAAESG